MIWQVLAPFPPARPPPSPSPQPPRPPHRPHLSPPPPQSTAPQPASRSTSYPQHQRPAIKAQGSSHDGGWARPGVQQEAVHDFTRTGQPLGPTIVTPMLTALPPMRSLPGQVYEAYMYGDGGTRGGGEGTSAGFLAEPHAAMSYGGIAEGSGGSTVRDT